MIVWALVLAAIIAILFFGMYPRTDYITTVEKPTYPRPIVAFVNAHEAAKQFIYGNYTINTEIFGADKGNITYTRPTNGGVDHLSELDSYMPDGDTHTLNNIGVRLVCLNNNNINDDTVPCNAANTTDFLISHQKIEADWDVIYSGWKTAFWNRTNKNDFCGIYNGTTLKTLNGTEYTLPTLLRPTNPGGETIMCVTINPAYSHSGLVAMYDGINNIGMPTPVMTLPNPTPVHVGGKVWKNLAGNKSYDIQNNNIGSDFVWHSDSLEHRQNQSVFLDTKLDMRTTIKYFTIEAIYDFNEVDSPEISTVLQQAGCTSLSAPALRINYGYGTFGQLLLTVWADSKGSISNVLTEDLFQVQGKNPHSIARGTQDLQNAQPSLALFKETGTYLPHKKINMVRVYNRPLTSWELNRNYLVDEQRFLLQNLYNETDHLHTGYISGNNIQGFDFGNPKNLNPTTAPTVAAIIAIPAKEGKKYRIINLKTDNPNPPGFTIGFSQNLGNTALIWRKDVPVGTISAVTEPAPASTEYLIIHAWAEKIDNVPVVGDSRSTEIRVYEERD